MTREAVYQEILYEVEEPIATITLNRPDQLNAWTNGMGNELKHAVAEAESDERVVVIVLTGAGRGFCAGADMKGLQSLSQGSGFGAGGNADATGANPGDAEMAESFRGTYSYLMSVTKPIVAAINGPCAGMGMPIALFCDIRFASDRAVFTTAFSRRGLIAEWGIAWTLQRVVGTAHAMDLILSGRRFESEEAERLGVVNRVVPHDELMKHTLEYAREMAANASPTSMRVMKRQIYEAAEEPLADANRKAESLMVESLTREDFREGVQSFLEKRPPKFRRV